MRSAMACADFALGRFIPTTTAWNLWMLVGRRIMGVRSTRGGVGLTSTDMFWLHATTRTAIVITLVV